MELGVWCKSLCIRGSCLTYFDGLGGCGAAPIALRACVIGTAGTGLPAGITGLFAAETGLMAAAFPCKLRFSCS